MDAGGGSGGCSASQEVNEGNIDAVTYNFKAG
jgi:hypothetical protein